MIPCALCQQEAAAFYCVNDDAHLCVGCDASVHAANPLLARHERRALSALACQAECASAANTSTTDADVAVVPQLFNEEEHQTVEVTAAAAGEPIFEQTKHAAEPALAPAPLTLYEDSFFAHSLSASDMLDLDSDDLELPSAGAAAAFCFDPVEDCVVPSFADALRPAGAGSDRFLTASSSGLSSTHQAPTTFFSQQPSPYLPYVSQQHQASALVPLGNSMGSSAVVAAKPRAAPKQRTPEEEAAEAARLARHRERQRKKRNFGRAVRYQSRRAYAEIRPRIKGRFVTPEEYAQYQTQASGDKAGVMFPGSYVPGTVAAPLPLEEDAVVPLPSFVV